MVNERIGVGLLPQLNDVGEKLEVFSIGNGLHLGEKIALKRLVDPILD